MDIKVKDFLRDVQNTRQGYFTLVLDDLAVKKCVAHKHQNGKVWFSPPAVYRPEGFYENIVSFESSEKRELVQSLVANLLAQFLTA